MSAGIEVTSRTQSVENMAQSFGVEAPPAPEAPASEPETSAAPPAAASADAGIEAEIDRLEPPPANETPEAKTQRRSGALNRMHAAIRKQQEAEARARALEAKVAILEGQQRQPAPATQPPAPAQPQVGSSFAFPSFDEYLEQHPDATHEAYTDARTDARVAWRDETARAEAARATAEAHARQAVTEAQSRFATFRAATPDFDTVLAAAPDGSMSPAMLRVFAEHPDGPALAYHLAQPANHAEARRIAALPPAQAAAELGALLPTVRGAGRPVAAPAPSAAVVAPPPPPSTRAPAPLAPVRGVARSHRTLHQIAADSGEDGTEYMRVRREQLAQQRRGY